MDYVLLAAVSTAEHAAQCFVNKLNNAILFPLITLLLAMAFLVFLYGCFEYVRNASSDAGRETGKQHILYGTIGMLIMISAHSILSITAGTFSIPLFNTEVVDCSAAPVVTSTVGDVRNTPTFNVSTSAGMGAYRSDDAGQTGTYVPGTNMIIPGTDSEVGELPSLQPVALEEQDVAPEFDTTVPCLEGSALVGGVCVDMQSVLTDNGNAFGTGSITEYLNDEVRVDAVRQSIAEKEAEYVRSGMDQQQAQYEAVAEVLSESVIFIAEEPTVNEVQQCVNGGHTYVSSLYSGSHEYALCLE